MELEDSLAVKDPPATVTTFYNSIVQSVATPSSRK
jgi:hypothetical protein